MAFTCTKQLFRKILTMMVLIFLNMLNYMDRFTIAGVLGELQKEFDVGDDVTGFLQTIFTVAYMFCCPLCGYLGDRFSRRLLLGTGVFIWSTSNILGSFMPTYTTFAICRSIVGAGEALYTTIAPTLIADLFLLRSRAIMLALFYAAAPFGCGLGYIVGTSTCQMTNDWRWSMRVTPFIGAIFLVLIFFIYDPKRGESEGRTNMKTTSYREDLKHLSENVSYILVLSGTACISFIAGAMAWWGPKTFYLGINEARHKEVPINEVGFIFGSITITCGIIGVLIGSLLSQILIKYISCIDPIICGANLILSFPLIDATLFTIVYSPATSFALFALGGLGLNGNFAILVDITFYIVVPTRRSTASAIQMFAVHTFGDSISPYIVGILSEQFKIYLNGSKSPDGQYPPYIHFQGLRYSLFCTNFLSLLGGACFIATAFHVDRDREKAEAREEEEGNQVT